MAMAKILRLLTLGVTCLMALSGAASAQEKPPGATAAQPRSAAELGNLAEKLELTLKAAEDRGDKKAVIKELLNLGQVQAEMGNQSRALASIEMAKRLASDLGDKELKLASLAALAKSEADSGDMAQAIQTQKEAVDLSKEATDAKGQVAAMNALAKLYLKSGEPDKALAQLNRALQMANTTNDEAGQREALTAIATVYAQRKDHARALSYNETALELYRKVGDGEGMWRSMAGIADAKAALGKPDEALASYTEATKVIEAQAAQRTGTGRPDPQAADKAAVYDKAIQLLRQSQKEGEAAAYTERAKNLGYAQVPSAAAAVAAVAKT
ncbi:MAG: tetratricopeptide repeat protein, partial [Planctomycetes bacterium]|nr:tetratricopeptide repeat protein [Planctomycetota bacterium]